jgi:hypothetical protein
MSSSPYRPFWQAGESDVARPRPSRRDWKITGWIVGIVLAVLIVSGLAAEQHKHDQQLRHPKPVVSVQPSPDTG